VRVQCSSWLGWLFRAEPVALTRANPNKHTQPTYKQEIKAHPFFEGIDWASLHAAPSPYVPRVDHELDTQNFERFDEDTNMNSPGKGSRLVWCGVVWCGVVWCAVLWRVASTLTTSLTWPPELPVVLTALCCATPHTASSSSPQLGASGTWPTPTSSATPTKTGRRCTRAARWVLLCGSAPCRGPGVGRVGCVCVCVCWSRAAQLVGFVRVSKAEAPLAAPCACV
jgi:hypothetical protein